MRYLYSNIASAIVSGDHKKLKSLVSRVSIDLNRLSASDNTADNQHSTQIHPLIRLAVLHNDPISYMLLMNNGLSFDIHQPDFLALVHQFAPNIEALITQGRKSGPQSLLFMTHYPLIKIRKLRQQVLNSVFNKIFTLDFFQQHDLSTDKPETYADYLSSWKYTLPEIFSDYHLDDGNAASTQRIMTNVQQQVIRERAELVGLIDLLGEWLTDHILFKGISRAMLSTLGDKSVARKLTELTKSIAAFLIHEGCITTLGLNTNLIRLIHEENFKRRFYEYTTPSILQVSDAEILRSDMPDNNHHQIMSDFCIGLMTIDELQQLLTESSIIKLLLKDGADFLLLAYQRGCAAAVDYLSARRCHFQQRSRVSMLSSLNVAEKEQLKSCMLSIVVSQLKAGLSTTDPINAPYSAIEDFIALFGQEGCYEQTTIDGLVMNLDHYLHCLIGNEALKKRLLSLYEVNNRLISSDEVFELLSGLAHLGYSAAIEAVRVALAWATDRHGYFQQHGMTFLRFAMEFGYSDWLESLYHQHSWLFSSQDHNGRSCIDYLNDCDVDVMQHDIKQIVKTYWAKEQKTRFQNPQVIIIDFNILIARATGGNVSEQTLRLPERSLDERLINPNSVKYFLQQCLQRGLSFYIVSNEHKPHLMERVLNLIMDENKPGDTPSISKQQIISVECEQRFPRQVGLNQQILQALKRNALNSVMAINPSNVAHCQKVILATHEPRYALLASQSFTGITCIPTIVDRESLARRDWHSNIASQNKIDMRKAECTQRVCTPARNMYLD